MEMSKNDELVFKLLHYFITNKGYNPVILHGAKDEIWLENLNSDYKIVRLVSNYIHNNEHLLLLHSYLCKQQDQSYLQTQLLC